MLLNGGVAYHKDYKILKKDEKKNLFLRDGR